MEKKVERQNLIWAVDAFDESTEVFLNTVHLLRALSKTLPAKTEPIYILSPDQLNLSTDFAPESAERYFSSAKKALDSRLKSVDIPDLLPGNIVVRHRASLRESVAALLAYAKSKEAHALVIGSHGRNGLARFFLGSFAEEVLLQAELPVLLTNPKANVSTGGVKKILVPTDLGAGAHSFLQKAIQLAQSLDARLTLLHSIPRAFEPVLQSGIYLMSGGWVPYPELRNIEVSRQTEAAAEWKAHALRNNVDLEWVIDTQSPSVTQSILDQSKKLGVDMIAMEAQSGRAISALIGSITRQVVRAAECPVWTLRVHPEKR